MATQEPKTQVSAVKPAEVLLPVSLALKQIHFLLSARFVGLLKSDVKKDEKKNEVTCDIVSPQEYSIFVCRAIDEKGNIAAGCENDRVTTDMWFVSLFGRATKEDKQIEQLYSDVFKTNVEFMACMISIHSIISDALTEEQFYRNMCFFLQNGFSQSIGYYDQANTFVLQPDKQLLARCLLFKYYKKK